MPRWLLIVVGALLFCVVGGVIGGRMLLNRVQGELSEPVEVAIAEVIESSVLQSIHAQDASSGTIRLTQDDLEINTQPGLPGEVGFEVVVGTEGQDEVAIYGATTTIDDSGLTVVMMDVELQAAPVAEDGRIELTQRESVKGVTGWILSPDAIGDGIETGINNALQQAGLRAVSIDLESGSLTITTG